MAPRKRKINASTDEELMPPPQMPVPKKHKSTKQTTSSTVNNDSIISDITNISNTSTHQTQNKCGPLSLIFEKAQQNEGLHNKYFKELTNIYEKVRATPSIFNDFPNRLASIIYFLLLLLGCICR